ncbi:MAG TPA: nucleotidyltransferase family protein [Gemmatimonadales bacterium]|nr:nucleotidyltransferase family protein [Gemmatimonadales bacterium]
MLTDAVLLAAGKSTRIAEIGGGLPKPLLPIQGEPVLVRNVRWLGAAGVQHIWVNLHYRGDLIRTTLGDGSSWGVAIQYSEEPIILGTAGGVRQVLGALGDRFLVVYGDNLFDFDLERLVATHQSTQADITIALFDDHSPHTGMAGGQVIIDAADRVVSFVEGGTRDASRWINAAVYVVERHVLEPFPADTFLDWGKDIFPALLARGAHVQGHRMEGYCLALDTPASYERAMELMRSGEVVLK